MSQKLYSPNVIAVGSSKVGEDSLSHHGDPTVGVYIIDRYTYYALDFLEKVKMNSTKSLGQFLSVCPKRVCISTVVVRKDLFARDPHKVPLTDFFGNIPQTKLLDLPTKAAARVAIDGAVADSIGATTVASQSKWHYVSQLPW